MTPLVSHLSQAEKRRKVSGPASRVAVGPTNALSLGYTIEGIVWNEMDPLALINDQVVGLREQLNDGSLIMEITPDTVRFTKNGNEYFLVFREE